VREYALIYHKPEMSTGPGLWRYFWIGIASGLQNTSKIYDQDPIWTKVIEIGCGVGVLLKKGWDFLTSWHSIFFRTLEIFQLIGLWVDLDSVLKNQGWICAVKYDSQINCATNVLIKENLFSMLLVKLWNAHRCWLQVQYIIVRSG